MKKLIIILAVVIAWLGVHVVHKPTPFQSGCIGCPFASQGHDNKPEED